MLATSYHGAAKERSSFWQGVKVFLASIRLQNFDEIPAPKFWKDSASWIWLVLIEAHWRGYVFYDLRCLEGLGSGTLKG